MAQWRDAYRRMSVCFLSVLLNFYVLCLENLLTHCPLGVSYQGYLTTKYCVIPLDQTQIIRL